MQPNTLSLSRSGGCPDQTSSGVFISNAVEGHLLMRYVAVETTSVQNTFFKPALVNMHLNLSKIVRLNLSAKPFCCGVPAVVLCLAIPEAAQKLSMPHCKIQGHCRFSTSLPFCQSDFQPESSNF